MRDLLLATPRFRSGASSANRSWAFATRTVGVLVGHPTAAVLLRRRILWVEGALSWPTRGAMGPADGALLVGGTGGGFVRRALFSGYGDSQVGRSPIGGLCKRQKGKNRGQRLGIPVWRRAVSWRLTLSTPGRSRGGEEALVGFEPTPGLFRVNANLGVHAVGGFRVGHPPSVAESTSDGQD